jgi:outer membrane protein OmpA-like peptidoglycan-associated protein
MTPAAIPSLLSLTIALQAPANAPVVPQRPGLTVVSAVAGDTLLGNSRGDYELAVTLTALSPAGAELHASSFVRNDAGRHEWLRFRRTVPASDLRSSRTQVLGFDSRDVEVVPGTTSLGPSLAVMAEVRRTGRVEFRVRNYADRRDNPGTLHRVGVETFPVLLNGRRVALPAVHMRGQLGPPSHLRPWAFWFFDDPMQPITLKVYYGAEGAPESARPEWLRQVIRIDVPDPDGGLGDLELAFGSPGAQNGAPASGVEGQAVMLKGDGDGGGRGALLSPAEGDGDAEGEGGDEGPDGAGTGSGEGTARANGNGSGAGAGGGAEAGTGRGVGAGPGAMAGMPREATGTCRVVVPGVYFEFDSDELNPASAPWIGLVARLLERHPDWTVTIEGHTDSIGGARYNQGLSERRAAALRRELVARHAIAAARLGTRGFGASRPLEPNMTLEGRARNRRVELVRPCGRPDATRSGR